METDLKELLRTVIREELNPIIKRIDLIEAEQQIIKQAVLETQEDLQSVKEEVQSIKEDVQSIKESVKHLEEIQINQQRIIELLSARSLQHEAELKRIK